jgi:glucokinase
MFGDVDFLPGWKGFNLVEDLSREFNVKAALENDADASALGEATWGAGKGKSRLIYVTVGTGIGGGIIVDGQIYRGADMSHPEIGHHVIETAGPLCSCGFHGCWESLATGPAMAAWFEAHTTKNEDYSGKVTAKKICELARQGNELAIQAVGHGAYYLGLGLANLINLFVPDMIVLGGSVMKSADLLLDGIRNVIRQGCRFVPFERTELALASLGENANLIGAARVWHHRYGQS